MDKPTKILTIAGEGGGLAVYGVQSGGLWSFKVMTNDHTPTLIDEEPIHGEPGWAPSLAECMAQVRYSWNCLSPTFVHPIFAPEIYELKRAKDVQDGKNSHVSGRWMQMCSVKPKE